MSNLKLNNMIVQLLCMALLSCGELAKEAQTEMHSLDIKNPRNSCQIDAMISIDTNFYDVLDSSEFFYSLGIINLTSKLKIKKLNLSAARFHNKRGWMKLSASSIYFYDPKLSRIPIRRTKSELTNISVDSLRHPVYVLNEISPEELWILDFVVNDTLRCSDTITVMESKAKSRYIKGD